MVSLFHELSSLFIACPLLFWGLSWMSILVFSCIVPWTLIVCSKIYGSHPLPYSSTDTANFSPLGGHNPVRGCIAAVDGIALRMRRPRVSKVPKPSSYWTRKGSFSVNFEAAVSGAYKVIFLSTVTAGPCHDSTAFS